jgi:replicative DNA helicase
VATEVITRERTLPHNAEAERTVLGRGPGGRTAFNSAAEILTRDDFYREAHRRIFDAMAALAERSAAIDLVTLKDELRAARRWRRWGAGLPGRPARRLPAHHERRALEPDHQGEGRAPEPHPRQQPHRAVLLRGRGRAAVISDRAEKALFDHAEHRLRQGFIGIREIVKESFRTIDQLSQSKEPGHRPATGLRRTWTSGRAGCRRATHHRGRRGRAWARPRSA